MRSGPVSRPSGGGRRPRAAAILLKSGLALCQRPFSIYRLHWRSGYPCPVNRPKGAGPEPAVGAAAARRLAIKDVSRLVRYTLQDGIDDLGAHGDQHHVGPQTAPFVTRTVRQLVDDARGQRSAITGGKGPPALRTQPRWQVTTLANLAARPGPDCLSGRGQQQREGYAWEAFSGEDDSLGPTWILPTERDFRLILRLHILWINRG